METPVLVDGCLNFMFRNEKHEIDLLLLKLACDEVETKHDMPVVDGRVQYTSEFLSDLAGKLQSVGILPQCTPTGAFQLWIVASQEMQGLKKNTDTMQNSPIGIPEPESSPAE